MKINHIRVHQAITRVKGLPLTQIYNKPESQLELQVSGVMATFPEESIFIPFANLPQVSFFKDEPPQTEAAVQAAQTDTTIVDYSQPPAKRGRPKKT